MYTFYIFLTYVSMCLIIVLSITLTTKKNYLKTENTESNQKSELVKTFNSKKLIVAFGGQVLKMGGIPPFEFLNYLTKLYTEQVDLIFYVDLYQVWYHKGLQGITNNIPETSEYLKKIVVNYEQVVFMGTSSGGYAAILFGSLCNVSNVIAFKPQTIVKNPIDQKYQNIKPYINNGTQYLIYADLSVQDEYDGHHINQCLNIQEFSNVKIVQKPYVDLKHMRDAGEIKNILNNTIKFE